MKTAYQPEKLERALHMVRKLSRALAVAKAGARDELDARLGRWNREVSRLDEERTAHFDRQLKERRADASKEAASRARFMTGPGKNTNILDTNGRLTTRAHRERDMLVMRRARYGIDSLTPDQLALTKVRDVGEDLWIRAACHEPRADETRTLTAKQEKAWEDWRQRAVANPLSVSVEADGGATVPTDFVADVFRDMALSGPMLDPMCSNQLMTQNGRPLDWPTETGGKTRKVQLLTVGEDMVARKTLFGKLTLNAPEWGDMFAIPWTLFQDTSVPMEQLLREIMVEAGVRGLNEAFTTGDDSGDKPEGLTANTDKVTQSLVKDGVKVGIESALSAVHDIDPIYRSSPRCQFQFHDTVIEAFRKETVDAAYGFIWQTDARSGAPSRLFGYPVKTNQAFAPLGASALVGCFGDMAGYVTRLVSSMSIRRLDEISALARQHVLQYVLRADGRWLSKDRVTIFKAAA